MKSTADAQELDAPVPDSSHGNALPLEEGTFCVIWVRTDSRSVLRILEVLEVNGEENSFLGWYHIHLGEATFDPERPLVERRLSPEWAHNRTQRRAKPKLHADREFNPPRAKGYGSHHRGTKLADL